MRWKIKRFSNDELRQKFVDATVPQADYLGLTFPDPELRLDEASRALDASARSTGPSSSEVVAGNGPCNRERLKARQKAHEDGAWVREAAMAFAEKRRRREQGRGGMIDVILDGAKRRSGIARRIAFCR